MFTTNTIAKKMVQRSRLRSTSEPPPNERIRSAHPMLDHILRRCFEKDPDRRWQSIGDVTGELRWVRENPAAPPAPAGPAPTPTQG